VEHLLKAGCGGLGKALIKGLGGVMAAPTAAAVCANSSSEACGLARKPNPSVWLNVAPPSRDWRWTKRVVWAASSAVVVKIAHSTGDCGIVVIGEAPLKGIMLCVVTT
jgi:hypothetical protein